MYADVLIFLNLIVDYLLLLVTSKIIRKNAKTFRMVISALVGGFSSLYIFLPQQQVVVEFIYKIVVSFIMTILCFGVNDFKQCLRNTGILLIVTSAYAGLMFAFWLVFKPYGMVVNNSIVYFNISPTVLVICSAAGYLLFVVLSRIFKRQGAFSQHCDIRVFADGRDITLDAIVDTGNSIEDAFSNSEIIIANKKDVEKLFCSIDCEDDLKLKSRFRILPCSTVSGFDTLEGFRCDRAEVVLNNKKKIIQKPILAISKINITDGYDAIINPKILE